MAHGGQPFISTVKPLQGHGLQHPSLGLALFDCDLVLLHGLRLGSLAPDRDCRKVASITLRFLFFCLPAVSIARAVDSKARPSPPKSDSAVGFDRVVCILLQSGD